MWIVFLGEMSTKKLKLNSMEVNFYVKVKKGISYPWKFLNILIAAKVSNQLNQWLKLETYNTVFKNWRNLT